MDSEGNRLASVNQIAAAVHNHVSNDLLAVTQFLDQVAEERGKVDFQIDEVLLEQQSDYFDGGQRDLEVDIRDELIDEAEEGGRCLLC